MPQIDPATAPSRKGSAYPAPHDAPCRDRERIRLGDAGGLSQFGVNLLRLPPGQWSSQRHWHEREDEFVMVLEGEVVLVTDAGERTLRRGDCAAFPAGLADGHHVQNRAATPALLLEVGARHAGETVHYSDIDLHLADTAGPYTTKDGTPILPS